MIYFYCIESEKGKTSGTIEYNDKVSTAGNINELIDFIYSEIKGLYGSDFTKENSVIISLNKL